MKYIRKFLENLEHNDKELMIQEFEEVFGFPLYHLIDRLIEWEDKGLNLLLESAVWIKSESNKKYNLSLVLDFPDISSKITGYVNQLFRYSTENKSEDNIEIMEFKPIDTKDIICGCIVIHVCFPNEMYLNDDNYKEREKYYEKEFENLIEMIQRQFPLIEIENTREAMMSATTRGVLLKRKND
jgi:hypothetical protein